MMEITKEMKKTDIYVGETKGKDIFIDTENAANQHMLVTGSTGTGKTNFLKVWLSQNVTRQTVVLDYSDSFPQLENAETISIFETSEIQGFFSDLTPDTLGSIADAIVGAWRFGEAQRATVIKALNNLMHQNDFSEIISMASADIFRPYLRRNSDSYEKSWSLFVTILNCKCGYKGEQIATRLLELVNAVSKSKISDKEKGINAAAVKIVKFPVESCGLNAYLAELYLWKFWMKELKERNPVTVILDECQDLNWKKGSIAERLLSQGRKFGIGIVLSTQFLSENFPKRIINHFQQSGVRVVFAPPEGEAKEIAQSFDAINWKNWVATLKRLRVGCCAACGQLKVNGRSSKQKVIVSVPSYEEFVQDMEKNREKDTKNQINASETAILKK